MRKPPLMDRRDFVLAASSAAALTASPTLAATPVETLTARPCG